MEPFNVSRNLKLSSPASPGERFAYYRDKNTEGRCTRANFVLIGKFCFDQRVTKFDKFTVEKLTSLKVRKAN